VNDNVGEGKLLLLSALLEASLHHTASVLMRAYLDAVFDACVEDELSKSLIALAPVLVRLLRVLGGLENAQKGLDDMIPVGTLLNFSLNSLTKLSSFIYGYRYEITLVRILSACPIFLLMTSTRVCTALVPCTFIEMSTRHGLIMSVISSSSSRLATSNIF
jgi:hypothetical protein